MNAKILAKLVLEKQHHVNLAIRPIYWEMNVGLHVPLVCIVVLLVFANNALINA